MNLNQITIPTIDLVKSVVFYQKLGLKLIVNSVPIYARFECSAGDATFSIHQVDKLPEGNGIIIYFELKDLDVTVEKILNEVVEFEELPTDKEWLWCEARLNDPNRNQLILYYAGEN